MGEAIMNKYEQTGVLSVDDLFLPSKKQLQKGVAITECIQEIPCNPCVDSCPVNAISMKDINAPPIVDYDICIACGNCVGVCPGLAIFVVKKTENRGLITLPYEFLPVPKKDDEVITIDRDGKKVGIGIIKKVKKQGKTMVITVELPAKDLMNVRHIRTRNPSD
jgi:Fe-S-cluster-containing hydrogenase component 2